MRCPIKFECRLRHLFVTLRLQFVFRLFLVRISINEVSHYVYM